MRNVSEFIKYTGSELREAVFVALSHLGVGSTLITAAHLLVIEAILNCVEIVKNEVYVTFIRDAYYIVCTGRNAGFYRISARKFKLMVDRKNKRLLVYRKGQSQPAFMYSAAKGFSESVPGVRYMDFKRRVIKGRARVDLRIDDEIREWSSTQPKNLQINFGALVYALVYGYEALLALGRPENGRKYLLHHLFFAEIGYSLYHLMLLSSLEHGHITELVEVYGLLEGTKMFLDEKASKGRDYRVDEKDKNLRSYYALNSRSIEMFFNVDQLVNGTAEGSGMSAEDLEEARFILKRLKEENIKL